MKTKQPKNNDVFAVRLLMDRGEGEKVGAKAKIISFLCVDTTWDS